MCLSEAREQGAWIEREKSICIKTRKLWPAWWLARGLVCVSRFCKLFPSIQCISDGLYPGCSAVNSASCSCMQQFSRINLKLQLLHLLTALCVRTLERYRMLYAYRELICRELHGRGEWGRMIIFKDKCEKHFWNIRSASGIKILAILLAKCVSHFV